MSQHHKILAAIDGSDQSLNAVRYIADFLPPEKTDVVLFHVSAEVPESFLDMRKDSGFRSTLVSVSSWAVQHKENIQEFMEKARMILIKSGFAAESLKVKIQSKKVGVARDIIKESFEGYDAVVMGRSGVNKLKDVIVGSVANKLIGKALHVPIVAVGGRPEPSKIIIGFDGSDGAMKAVNCVSALMNRPGRNVLLCHVIRALNIHAGFDTSFSPQQEEEWIRANTEEMESALAKAENRLIQEGFPEGNVSTLILKGMTSRSDAIAKKASADGCGTIVVGRRGLTVVEEFIMGRVSRKVLSIADKMAVWIV